MDTDNFKKKIQDELSTLTAELKSVGRINPDNPADWEATPEDMDIDTADSNVVADKFEEYEANSAVLKQLEIRYNELKNAAAKIENGTYGTCEICGKQIEEERLDVNAAARTCSEHRES